MRRALIFALIAAVVIATRLCHSSVLWADDNLPLAAAMQIARMRCGANLQYGQSAARGPRSTPA